MKEFAGSENGDPESSFIPVSAVLSSSFLQIKELYRRPSHPRDYANENRALVALTRGLTDSPHTILQTLADMILEMFQAGSAGVSLLTTEDSGKRHYCPVIVGKWKSQIAGGTLRDFGLCGDVLNRNTRIFFRHIERQYTYFKLVTLPVEDCLLVPFFAEGKAVGTIWAVAHDSRRKFDAEDERLMSSLGTFASLAYQVTEVLDIGKYGMIERTRTQNPLPNKEEQLRILADTFKNEVRLRTQQLEERNVEVLRYSEQLRELSNRLQRTQDDERRRIARELHDSAGQIIAVLSLNLASITPRVKRRAAIDKTIKESLDLIHELSDEIRTMAYLLHPPLLDENGLSGAIEWYAAGLSDRSGLQVGVEISEEFGRLPGEMETALFRIVQECLTNIHRHSGSKTATIRLSRRADSVSLELQDDGRGISSEKLAGIQSQRSGVGIAGMRERVRHLKGVMDIQSDSCGTKVSITLPITETSELGKIQSAGAAG
jgi:signal transduction histidine kinase